MKIRLFIIGCVVLLLQSITLLSQTPARAIVNLRWESDDILVRMMLDQLDKKVIAYSDKYNLVLYHGSETKSTIAPHPHFVGKERPCSEIIYLRPKIWFDHQNEFVTIQDTTGKTTHVFFKMNHGAIMDIKAIELATSRIIKYSFAEILKPSAERMDVKDFVKVFGGDPHKVQGSDPEKYSKILENLKKEYKQKIFDYYKSRVESSFQRGWFSPDDFAADEKIYEAIPPKDLNVKKINDFNFNGGLKDNLIRGRVYHCITRREIDGYYYYENLTRVKIKEIGENESTMTSLWWGSKELAESLKKGEKVLLVPEDVELVIRQLENNKKDLKISIAIEKPCIFCAIENEKFLLNHPVINLVERASPELKYFGDLAKRDDFIDYSIKDLQGKKVGLDLYIVKRDKFLEGIEVSTNKIVASIDMTFKFLGLSWHDAITSDILSLLLSSYKPNDFGIEFIKVIEEKKEKIEKILAYNPIGFDRLSKYDIYTLIEEEVDGEIMSRKNILGQCVADDYYSLNLATLKIKKGEKEIFKALKQNQKIYFINSIKD